MSKGTILGFVAGAVVYVGLAFAATVYLPAYVVQRADVAQPGLSESEISKALIVSRDGVRQVAVDLVGAATLAVAGLVAVFTFSTQRRDGDREARRAHAELFGEGIKLLGGSSSDSKLGGVMLLREVAREQKELRLAVVAVLISSIRDRCTLPRGVAVEQLERSAPSLIDRDPVSASAVTSLGQIDVSAMSRTGSIVERNLSGCDLRGLDLSNGRFDVVDFTGSCLWDARLEAVSFEKCVLHGVRFEGSRLVDVRFSSCDLTYASLDGVDLERVTFLKCMGVE